MSEKNDILQKVFQVSDWIEQYEHITDKGRYWDALPGKIHDKSAVLTAEKSLYGGGAGIALFYLRLYQVTEDDKWLLIAKDGIDYIINDSDNDISYDNYGEGTLRGISTGLMNGPAGGAYISYLIYEATGEKKYLEYTEKIADNLIKKADKDEYGLCWSKVYGVLSDGGLVLFLICLYEKTRDKKYLEVAVLAGKRIAKLSDKAEVGIRWLAMDSVAFGLGEKGYFPGFFYGTAGTAYILAKLYEVSKEEEFLEKAIEGAKYIASIADYSEDKKAALIRYNDPYRKELHYLGVCQGPVGTSRLFYKLYQITQNKDYLDWVLRLTDGVIRAGAPFKHSPGYWHTYSYCCGAAGMLEHFMAIYKLTNNKKYEEAAKESAEVLIGDSYEEDGKRRWYTAWNRHLPNEVEAWTGLYHGSAGCAFSLLSYFNFYEKQNKLSGFIEDPFE